MDRNFFWGIEKSIFGRRKLAGPSAISENAIFQIESRKMKNAILI
jgi:hypothetical protein